MTWIDSLIDEARAVLCTGNLDQMQSYVRKTVGAISEDVPTARKGLHYYQQRMTIGDQVLIPYTKEQAADDVQTLTIKLERLRDEKSSHAPAYAQSAAPTVHIENNPHMSSLSTSSAQASSAVSLASAIGAIMALDPAVLSSDEKVELTTMLSSMEQEDRESDGFKEKAMKVIKFLSTKSFEVVKIALPALIALMG